MSHIETIKDLDFPTYIGNETEYEHIFYTYLDLFLNEIGYITKIKKTGYENIDKNIESMAGISNGSCDSYILSNNTPDSLFALVELESTGNLHKGIVQVRKYAKGLASSFKTKKFINKHEKILLFVYDGTLMWGSEYNLQTDEELIVISEKSLSEDGIVVTNTEKETFFNLFPIKNKINTSEDEKTLIKNIKKVLRGNKSLQGNKAFLLTVLASIYGDTKKETFKDAVEYLRTQSKSNKETEEIYDKWNRVKNKIDYDNSNDTKNKISKLYEDVSIKLYLIAQDKKLDLYGYIYEELAEKTSKKEDGEYYTPRTHIRPIVNSVFEKYLKNAWQLKGSNKQILQRLNSKNILDPFCGSGGFLYEYLKILKQKYALSNLKINEIASNSVNGFDKNDITSAYFNLFLIGDGRSNLSQVTTSINWENFWKFKNQKQKNNTPALISNIENLKKNIEANIETFVAFLNNIINMDYIKNTFSFYDDYEDIETAEELLKSFADSIEKKVNELFYELASEKYKNFNQPLLLFFYEILAQVSDNIENIDFQEFSDNMGNVDLLMTNVPYGDIDDIRFKTSYGAKLESTALKECIDLLKPSSHQIDNTTGQKYSLNDGGIATIVIPNGLIERDELELKKYLIQRCDILSIVKLPFYTFSPYALIQTYVITIRKKATFQFSKYIQEHQTFMYIIDNDGKANSDRRFETKLISKDRNNIQGKVIHEYIHDELSTNLESYPEGYFSKLERSWIYGNANDFDQRWNQQRITEKWDGKKWKTLKGKKWSFQNLQIKEYKKQIEIKKKKINDAIIFLLENNKDFRNYFTDEKKKYIAKQIREEYFVNISSIDYKDNIIVIKNNNNRTINNNELSTFIHNYFLTQGIKDTGTTIEYIRENYSGTCNANIDDAIEILESLDDIIIFDFEIKLIKKQTYNLYDLKIDNYLIEDTDLDSDTLSMTLIRLFESQKILNYNKESIFFQMQNATEKIKDKKDSNIIPLYEIIESYKERGDRIRIEDIYNLYGEYPVYSSTITGNIGYYNNYNCEIQDNTLLYAIEGNAGSISIPFSKTQKIWLLDVGGIINIKSNILETFSKESIAIYLDALFKKNRHNNSGQPKFLLKNNFDLEIDLSTLRIIEDSIKKCKQ